MKHLKLLTIFIITITLLSFKPQKLGNNPIKQNLDTHQIKKNKNDILGTWIKQTDLKSSKPSITDHIIEIKFKKNFTAKVKVSDSLGTRTITGKWSAKATKNYKKIAGDNTKLPSNTIILEYIRNGKGLNIITLIKTLKDGKLLLKGKKVQFEKK